MGYAFTLTRDTNKTDLTTMAMTATATIVTQTNIAGTDGTARIIGTIMIAIMIGIDAWRFFRITPRCDRR
jgi:hypothetical protein